MDRRHTPAAAPEAPTVTRPALAGMIELPRIELPAGVARPEVTDVDQQLAHQLKDMRFAGDATQRARQHQHMARKLQRRASGRPAAKRRKALPEAAEAQRHLITAGVMAGVAELLKHDMTATPERIAAIRERCQARRDEDLGAYAIAVQNWINDLAGEARLTRG